MATPNNQYRGSGKKPVASDEQQRGKTSPRGGCAKKPKVGNPGANSDSDGKTVKPQKYKQKAPFPDRPKSAAADEAPKEYSDLRLSEILVQTNVASESKTPAKGQSRSTWAKPKGNDLVGASVAKMHEDVSAAIDAADDRAQVKVDEILDKVAIVNPDLAQAILVEIGIPIPPPLPQARLPTAADAALVMEILTQPTMAHPEIPPSKSKFGSYWEYSGLGEHSKTRPSDYQSWWDNYSVAGDFTFVVPNIEHYRWEAPKQGLKGYFSIAILLMLALSSAILAVLAALLILDLWNLSTSESTTLELLLDACVSSTALVCQLVIFWFITVLLRVTIGRRVRGNQAISLYFISALREYYQKDHLLALVYYRWSRGLLEVHILIPLATIYTRIRDVMESLIWTKYCPDVSSIREQYLLGTLPQSVMSCMSIEYIHVEYVNTTVPLYQSSQNVMKLVQDRRYIQQQTGPLITQDMCHGRVRRIVSLNLEVYPFSGVGSEIMFRDKIMIEDTTTEVSYELAKELLSPRLLLSHNEGSSVVYKSMANYIARSTALYITKDNPLLLLETQRLAFSKWLSVSRMTRFENF
jgi:hypothetical protein